MSNLENALEDCLACLRSDESTLEECLARYPEYAAELRRLLAAAAPLAQGRGVRPAPRFKTRDRAQLVAYLRANPRPPRPQFPAFFSIWLALSLGVLGLVFLIVGAGAAQAALPGDFLHGWKLASERAWRALAPDPLAVDLALAERRAAELAAVSGDPTLEPLARQNYQAALSALNRYADPTARPIIATSLAKQKDTLQQAGLTVPELDDLSLRLAPPLTPPTPSPSLTAHPPPATSLPLVPAATLRRPSTPIAPEPTLSPEPLPLPTVEPTVLPTIIPSLQPAVAVTSIPASPEAATLIPNIVSTLLPVLPR